MTKTFEFVAIGLLLMIYSKGEKGFSFWFFNFLVGVSYLLATICLLLEFRVAK